MKQFIAAFLLPVMTVPVCSQDPSSRCSVTAEMRHRFELRDGYRAPAVEGMVPSGLIWQRTRLALDFESGPLTLRITPQDARLWGDESISSSTGIFGDQASVELYEAWAEVVLGSCGSMRLGRQELIFDNRRLFSERNWNNQGLTYDAALLRITALESDFHIGATWNSSGEVPSGNPYPSGRIKTIEFFRFHHNWSDLAGFSFVHIASGVTTSDASDTIRFRQTSGIYSEYSNGNVKIWCDAYGQYGKNRDGIPVRAFLMGADVHRVKGILRPATGFAYLSGSATGTTNGGKDGLFDILYGARHRFYGCMDYFTNIPEQTMAGGLTDLYADLECRFRGGLGIRDAGHYFMLARKDPGISDDGRLGFENDLTAQYRPCKLASVEIGWLVFVSTPYFRTMQSPGARSFSQFIYIQLNFNAETIKLNHHEEV